MHFDGSCLRFLLVVLHARAECNEKLHWAGVDLNHRHTDFQSVAAKSQDQQEQRLTDTSNSSLQTSLQRKSKNDPPELPSDLAEIVAFWPELPSAIRSAIVAIVRDFRGQ
jgi:hypothetical protein